MIVLKKCSYSVESVPDFVHFCSVNTFLMRIPGILILAFFPFFLFSQEMARFTVVAGDHDRLNCPVYVSLEQLKDVPEPDLLCLSEVVKSELKPVNIQFDGEEDPGFWFILDGKTLKNTERNFVLKLDKKEPLVSDFSMRAIKSEEVITLLRNNQKILNYQMKTFMPPEGVDPAYQKSAFIHPLWSPGGEVLTRIQPPDHYHHYGVWGPWTKTHIDGREVDFWNLVKKQGTVRFAGLSEVNEGYVFCGFKVHQEHVDFEKGVQDGKEQVAINEELSVRAWNLGGNVWLIDYTSIQSSPLENGILLDAYRYGGGIGFRATEKWKKDNCTVLTSEGKTRKDADGTTARWCRVEGESGSGRSGILFMDFPSNRAYPEPMRVWPPDANNNRGDLFFEFCPIRHESWKMENGKSYRLKYRLFVFDNELSAEDAENLWQSFAYPPEVIVESKN